MSGTELQQGSDAWRQARVGLITGSRVGAVLNCSPFTSRKKVLREMVDEANGTFSSFDNPAMAWGREHEEEAVKLYDFLYAGDSDVNETGFHVSNGLGASPDRLVGGNGLVEVKCPYGLREDERPVFRSIEDKDMKHYWHQVQMQLYVTDRQWCDFFQWTPHGYQCERVERKHNWYHLWRDAFDDFMLEYTDLLEKALSGGPEERVGHSARWAAAVEDYTLASRTEAAAKFEKDAAKQIMVGLMEEVDIDQCIGAGLKVQKVIRKGTVDYKALAVANLTKDVVGEIEDEYRRKDSSSWRIDTVEDEE